MLHLDVLLTEANTSREFVPVLVMFLCVTIRLLYTRFTVLGYHVRAWRLAIGGKHRCW